LHEGVQNENIAAHVRSHFSEIVGECSAFEIVKYIYGLLHSKRYREAFVDILSVAVPPIPIPNSSDEFWNYVQTGSELISLHLMEGIVVPKDFCVWCGQEKNEVASIRFEDEKLYSGLSPLFCNVPDESWTCFIGGYRPLKKWFSARKGVLLSKKDREHVRKMAWVLMRTTALCL
jgi:hypothetical protein